MASHFNSAFNVVILVYDVIELYHYEVHPKLGGWVDELEIGETIVE